MSLRNLHPVDNDMLFFFYLNLFTFTKSIISKKKINDGE